MSTYAILNANLSFREWREYPALPIAKAGRVLPQVVDSLPAFNAATQKVVEAAPIVGASDVRKTWSVVSLNAGELGLVADAAKLAEIAAEIVAMQAGSGTQAERAARLEKATAFLLKKYFSI